MSKLWGAIARRLWGESQPQPAPRPSAAGIARAAGWTKNGAGSWTHEALGVVERRRDGTWEAYTDMYDRGGFATMTAAMAWAQARAAEYMAEQAGAAAAQEPREGVA